MNVVFLVFYLIEIIKRNVFQPKLTCSIKFMNGSFYFDSRAKNSVDKGCFSPKLSNLLVVARGKPTISSSWEKFGVNQIFDHKTRIHLALLLILFLTILLLSGVAGASFIE